LAFGGRQHGEQRITYCPHVIDLSSSLARWGWFSGAAGDGRCDGTGALAHLALTMKPPAVGAELGTTSA
jgi:hypothetical protein